uniref:Uncharacterized protein n=1 Tax=Arundo donax TaxID=35708 RepID=A0A0A8XUM2_ARUDO
MSAMACPHFFLQNLQLSVIEYPHGMCADIYQMSSLHS